MKAVAIIPARGGSKGLPRKNVLPLCGKPLIAWTIESALTANSIERVVVSTDDPEITQISQRLGAEVVHRPGVISSDLSSSEDALLHALGELGIEQGPLAFLQCTAPLLLAEDIDGTLALLEHWDTAVTVAPWRRFLWRDAPGGAEAVGHDKERRLMRQELPPQFVEVGAVYAMTVEGLIQTGRRFHGSTGLYVIPPERGLEIDDEVDFALVETLLAKRIRSERASRLPSRVSAVIMDFDGVLTDNRAIVDQDGRESVLCHRGDGWALRRLREAGIRLLVLTGETNEVVRRRCEKLSVECAVAPDDKLAMLKEWLARNRIAPSEAIFVGNDEPDCACMLYSGCGVAPADAYPKAKAAAQIVLDSRGGYGCLRELADLIFTFRRESIETTACHRRDRVQPLRFP